MTATDPQVKKIASNHLYEVKAAADAATIKAALARFRATLRPGRGDPRRPRPGRNPLIGAQGFRRQRLCLRPENGGRQNADHPMETIILIVLAGLAWGSFLNVVIYRLPAGMSLLRPPSTCPACGARIKPYDNIPVVSYLLLRGACRNCGARIPVSYLLVEIITPAAFLVLHHYHGLSVHFFACGLFTSGLITLAFIDYRHKILPDEIIYPGIGLGLVYSFFRPDLTFLKALLGAAVGAGFLLLSTAPLSRPEKRRAGARRRDDDAHGRDFSRLGQDPADPDPGLVRRGMVGSPVLILIKMKDMQFSCPLGRFSPPPPFALVWGNGFFGLSGP